MSYRNELPPETTNGTRTSPELAGSAGCGRRERRTGWLGVQCSRRRGMAAYLKSVWVCRFFWLSLVRLDLRNRYRGSFLGVGWSLLQPIAMTVIICTMFSTVFKVPLKEFAPLVLSGMTFWAFVVSSTLSGCQCFFQAEG